VDIYTEEQQAEQLKQWWQENGKSVIAGIVLGLAAIFGWRWWQAEQIVQAEAASVIYQQMLSATNAGDAAGASEAAEQVLAKQGTGTYAVFAKLLLAKQALADKDMLGAEEHLRWALKKNRLESLGHDIRLRLARVLVAESRLDEALSLLEIRNRGAYSGSYDELRGDILALQGDLDAARGAYQQAQTKFRTAGADTAILEIKLDDLGRVEL